MRRHLLVLPSVCAALALGAGSVSAQAPPPCSWTGADTYEAILPADNTFDFLGLAVFNPTGNPATIQVKDEAGGLEIPDFSSCNTATGSSSLVPQCASTRNVLPFNYAQWHIPGSLGQVRLFTVKVIADAVPVVNLFGVGGGTNASGNPTTVSIPMLRRGCR